MTKSSLPPKIRGIVEYQLEHYYDSRRELKDAERDMMPSNTPKYSSDPVTHGEASRTTENVAIKIMASKYLVELEKTVNSIEYITNRLSREDYELIDLVFFKGKFTITGAGQLLNMSQRTAYRHVDAVLTALARELGLIPL